jgi:chromosome partitioning protein
MNTKIIAIAQHKGGVGKTTSAINIGAGLTKLGYKVLLVDLDAQANLTESLGLEDYRPTIEDALADGITLKPAKYGQLEVVPASLELAGVEAGIHNRIARESILKKALEPLKKKYDFILIDCPPSLGLLTINALTAADDLIIPLQAQYLAVRGLNSLLQIIEMVRADLNRKLQIFGVLITQYDRRKVLNRDMGEGIEKLFNAEVFRTRIRDNVALAEAPTAKQDIFTYAPASYGADDYLELSQEIIARYGLEKKTDLVTQIKAGTNE